MMAEFISPTLFLLICAVLGGLFGSFFNVVIYRFPKIVLESPPQHPPQSPPNHNPKDPFAKKADSQNSFPSQVKTEFSKDTPKLSLSWPPSHCPQCLTPIKIWHNLPILAYILLRGKCASCKGKIPSQYFFVELFSALIALAWALAFVNGKLQGPLESQWGILYMGMILIPISIIDFKYYLIPDAFTLTGILLGFILSFIPGGLSPLDSFLGLFLPAAGLFAIGQITSYLKKTEALGLGDIKLLAMAGAFLGPVFTLQGLILSSIYGMVYFAYQRLFTRPVTTPMPPVEAASAGDFPTEPGNSQKYIPFGPFLLMGLLSSALFGKFLWEKYSQLILG